MEHEICAPACPHVFKVYDNPINNFRLSVLDCIVLSVLYYASIKALDMLMEHERCATACPHVFKVYDNPINNFA